MVVTRVTSLYDDQSPRASELLQGLAYFKSFDAGISTDDLMGVLRDCEPIRGLVQADERNGQSTSSWLPQLASKTRDWAQKLVSTSVL